MFLPGSPIKRKIQEMKIKKNDINCSLEKSESKSCQVNETFGETFSRVLEQIYIEAIPEIDKAIAKELALIITEVYRLRPNDSVKIDNAVHRAADVAEIFSMISKEHIETVIRKNDERKYPVKYRKAYLRTLLYNSVFEYSSEKIEDM